MKNRGAYEMYRIGFLFQFENFIYA